LYTPKVQCLGYSARDTGHFHVSVEGVTPMAGRCLRVAILDDDPSVRSAISRLLNASGMISGPFASSHELFNTIALFDPDCIVLDLYMPGLDGLEVMQYLRQTGIKAPVILITAQDDPSLQETCLKAGAIAFMRKPLQATELLEIITRSAGSPV
jgi:FixJ family two-component response regulator